MLTDTSDKGVDIDESYVHVNDLALERQAQNYKEGHGLLSKGKLYTGEPC
jgi:hypothetical protein